jgi:integrase
MVGRLPGTYQRGAREEHSEGNGKGCFPLDIKGCLDRVKDRGTVAVARKVRVVCSQVYVYAIATARATYNPASSLSGYLPPISKTRKHFSAITEARELAPLLRVMDGYTGSVVTRSALKLLPMLLLRPGELRAMAWEELDLERGELMIPPERMKMKIEHLVPLPRQAVAALRDLYPLTRRSRYCFPSTRTAARCLSDNTLNAALRYMGYDGDTVTAHGFRATARTILDEVLGYRPDIIEHQLAHVVRDPNGRAYNRTTHLEHRREMLQRWADYLDEIKTSNGTINLPPVSSGAFPPQSDDSPVAM